MYFISTSSKRKNVDTLNLRFISPHRKGLVRLLYLYYLRFFKHPLIYIVNELEDCEEVLDLGCGRYSPISSIHFSYCIGVDLFLPYFHEAKQRKTHHELIHADIRRLEFKPKSFDAVIALDVIEHLTKKEGFELIKKMEQMARKKVILFTPNGYVHQTNSHYLLQMHKSGWSLNDFRKMGYICKGMNGIKFLTGEEAHVKFRPTLLWQLIRDLSQKIIYHFPQCAFHLLCVKEVRE